MLAMIKSPIVTTAWLEDNLHNKQVIILDTSMNKVVGKKPLTYDEPVFIPMSKRFDLENIFCNLTSSHHNAFPSQALFTQEAQKLGINADNIVVLYDNQGIYSAPRAWWVFQTMGFKHAVVLDGGLPQWLFENRATVSELSREHAEQGNIIGVYQSSLVCDSNYIIENITSDKQTIIDARLTARFLGRTAEPRAGVRSGHIPKSVNLPFAQILTQHRFKNSQQLANIFSSLLSNKCNESNESNESNEIIFTCGSGITACIIMLAAVIAGYQHTTLYDGSWSDWGSNDSLPVEKN